MMNDTQRKIIYAIAVTLVLALGIAWIVLPEPSVRSEIDLLTDSDKEEESATEEDNVKSDLKVDDTGPNSFSNNPTQSEDDNVSTDNEGEEEKIISVTLSVEGRFYRADVLEESNVIDAMGKIAMESDLKFETKNYPGLGTFVESINEVKNGNGKYWFLYVNDESSSIGASQYILSPGDEIEWQFKEQD